MGRTRTSNSDEQVSGMLKAPVYFMNKLRLAAKERHYPKSTLVASADEIISWLHAKMLSNRLRKTLPDELKG